MIYLDDKGYPVDQTKDGGDSAVRHGILSLCGVATKSNEAYEYGENTGMIVRHPNQVPWNNPKNFSRDQLMVFVGGLKASQSPRIAPQVFYAHLKRFFFAQNFERDHVGTTKYPWPHKVDGKWRLFDFADPLLPNHIGAIILSGRVRWTYPFLLLAYPWHLFSLLFHSLGSHHEENQMIAECYIYGTLKVYKRIHKKWKEVSEEYWKKRNEIEYHDMLVKLVEDI